MLRVVEHPSENHQSLRTTLDDLLRQGVLTMLQQALEAEVEGYVARQLTAGDQRARPVARGGKARRLVTGTGASDAGGQRPPFTSEILPTYMRRAPKVTETLSLLYLRGLSTGDFQAALPVLLGNGAAGLSPAAIARLTAGWSAEYDAWRTASLAEKDYVYVWVDAVHFRVRPEEDRLSMLVMIGVRPDGSKEIVAVEDGYRESTDSWAAMLHNLKHRGLRAPMVVVGDSGLGFWPAVGTVWAEARDQRCWVHRLAHGRQPAN